MAQVASAYLKCVEPEKVISGMAQGWDQVFARAAVRLSIPFIAAVPFADQPNPWPLQAREAYFALLAKAQRVEIIDPVGAMNINAAMQKRNEWMVDHCDRLAALWDGSFGGTHNCLVYARRVGRPIDNLWTDYEALL